MKCPKCGYLGFQSVERCRNCGYDFSLATAAQPDLPIRDTAESLGPFDELPLSDPAAPPAPDRLRATQATAGRTRDRRAVAELPLFGEAADDAPLIARVSPPRQPLAVRRSTPEIPRLRSETRESLELTLSDPASEPPRVARVSSAMPPPRDVAATVEEVEAASLVRRFFSAVIDAAILAAIDVPVIYLTLQICGLSLAEIGELPKAPLAAFLVLLGMGYHVGFTAGGQTPGQMALGVRVVDEESAAPPGLTKAVVRTVVWALSLLPAGLGLTSVLLDEQRRGLHDRFAATRVLRAVV